MLKEVRVVIVFQANWIALGENFVTGRSCWKNLKKSSVTNWKRGGGSGGMEWHETMLE